MNTETATITPKLGKPGAGLPFLQELALRWYVGPFVAARASWDEVDTNLEKLNGKILKLVEGLEAERMQKRVLVPPQKGLEDSSRYWSVAMALEHLTLVGNHMKAIIIDLSQGQVPNVNVDTALVKPKGEQTAAQAVDAFRAFATTIIPDMSVHVRNRKSATKLKHPWFGPFTAKQWHWLLVGHTLVHYQQIKSILATDAT